MLSDDFLKGNVYRVLCVFDEYCARHHVSYTLAYGTLLGAVRHQGFIPWDDDIDVIVTTEEYYKLRNLARIDPYLDEEKRYRFLLPGDKDYCYSFIKVIDTRYRIKERNIDRKYAIGLYIDVFRVDNWPDDPVSEWIQLKGSHALLRMNEVCIRGDLKDEKLKRIDKLLGPVDFAFRVLGLRPENICLAMEKIGRHNRPGKYMGNVMSGSGSKKEKLESGVFDGLTYLKFEDRLFPCPEKYDSMLKRIYGDYMKLPDPAHRVSNHEYTIEETD